MLLLSHRLDVVSAERLIDALWGEQPHRRPRRRRCRSNISQLRRRARGRTRIARSAGGYATPARSPAQLDLERFETAGRARPTGEAAACRPPSRLREALALFRGPPLRRRAAARLRGMAEADRLEALRLDALEHADRGTTSRSAATPTLVAELEALAAEHPLPRAPARAADARALPLRPPGGRARGLPARAPRARRGPRARPQPRAQAPRGRDPLARSRAGARHAAPAHRSPPRSAAAASADPADRPRRRPRDRRGAAR